MTRPERRREKKKYKKDFAAFCRITSMQKMTDEFLSRLKKEYPCLPVCVLADSLYASEPVFKRCIKENKWHILLRYKEGSVPSIAGEYHSIADMGEAEELDKQIAREYPRKGKAPHGVEAGDRLSWI